MKGGVCERAQKEEAIREVLNCWRLSLFRDGRIVWRGREPGEKKNGAHQRADNRKVVVALMRISRWLLLINHLQQLKINQSVTRQVGVMRVFIEGNAHAKELFHSPLRLSPFFSLFYHYNIIIPIIVLWKAQG
jgi:hypothetical protein